MHMELTRRIAVPALVIALAGCASSPAATPPAPVRTSATTTSSTTSTANATTTSTSTTTTTNLNAVGTFNFETELQGNPMTGQIVIKDNAGSLTGVVAAHGQGEFPMSGIKVEGNTITFSFDTPNGLGTGKLVFVNQNEFGGGWELAGTTGQFKGKRQ